MTLLDSKIDENEIKRYLFAEMDAAERDEFDERLFSSDELFYDVSDLENRLVDDYVRGKLPAVDLTRFEQSLERVPERRQRIANARSLTEFIEESRPVPVVEESPQRRSISQVLASLFGGRSPAFAYGMAALVIILAVSTTVLIFQNQRKNSEIASLREQQQRQAELEQELDASRKRETELQNESGDFADELEHERNRREEIEKELGKLKNNNTAQPNGPIIASFILTPIGGRGGNVAPDVKITADTKRLSMRVSLPDFITAEDRLTVRLNQKVISKNVAPRGAAGNFSVNVSVPVQNLPKGKNSLDVVDADGKAVGSYGFNLVNK